jgi:hypothetical protein
MVSTPAIVEAIHISLNENDLFKVLSTPVAAAPGCAAAILSE